MFDSRQIEYIIAIADEHSLTKAAQKLFITQSALSQQLRKLEQEGLPPLFVYRGGRMELTDAGKLYVNGARTVLKMKEEGIRSVRATAEEAPPARTDAPSPGSA